MGHRHPLAIFALGTGLLLGACYRSYGRSTDGSSSSDGGLDARVADATIDGGRERDGAADARPDARLDAAPDAAPDSGPPLEGPPPVADRCRTEPTVHPFDDPVLEFRWPQGPVVHRDSVHVSMTPLVIDLDPSDSDQVEPELVFVSYPPLRGGEEPPGILRIVDPQTQETVSWPAEEGQLGVLEATTNLAAGDLDGDGRNEIVGIGSYSHTYAFRSDGTLLWDSPYPTARERGTLRSRSISGAPTLADLDGDGTVEVLVGRTVLEGATGELRFQPDGDTGRGRNSFLGPIACAADLDEDGTQEVIAGRTAFRANGDVMWSNDEAPDGLCAVADVLPEHAGPEVVLSGNGYLRLLDGQTGEQLWLRRLEGRVRISVGGAPTVADFDGDGRVEIGVAHGGAYGVYDPECEGPGRPETCTGEGLLWQAPTSDGSSSGTGSSVFDFNGDGQAEVVYNDEDYFRIYDGTTGRPLFQHRNSSRTRTENPTIADVDNDGDAEIVFCANAEAFFIRESWTDPGVEVWGDRRGRWVGARRIWNQHAYHITNVTETGQIPAEQTPIWRDANIYRQNLREDGDVLAVPDLWGGRGSYECLEEGRAELRIEVQNWGLERAGAGVVVGFYRGRPREGNRIGQARTTRTLEPRGDSETVRFEVELGSEPVTYYAVLDDPASEDGGTVDECLEDNNEVVVWQASCP
jgi:hypothetical protein